MAHEITQREYWKEVKDVAKEIVRETKDQNEDRMWAFDRLHEWIDGHEWIIYTWANPYILIHCDNEDAYFDTAETLTADSYSEAVQKMAFYAFLQDVGAELEEQLAKAGIE